VRNIPVFAADTRAYTAPLMSGRQSSRRILLVTNWVGFGGAESQLDYLSIGLRERGYEVEMLAIGSLLRETATIEAAGVEVRALEARGTKSKLRALPRVVKAARRADLVHCTGWDATFWGRLAAVLARTPAIFTEHTPGRDLQVTPTGASRAKLIAAHNRLFNRTTYAVIAVGEWQRALLEGEGVSGSKIVHVPNAVPIAELRKRAGEGPSRAELGIPDEAKVVVEVARFWSQKRQAVALRTVAKLRERLGDVHMVFVGDGPDEAAVKREAEQLGAGEWAHFLGFRGDVPGLVALSDLSVLPSTGEGLPMSLIESIALGTPTVGTDVGDVRWLLETTGAGICVSPRSEDDFVEACARALGDAELRARMVADGERTVGMFDAPKMVDRYAQVFESGITGAPLLQPEIGA
jgi:glycosyltransferase involved in cell wall biosynthesis